MFPEKRAAALEELSKEFFCKKLNDGEIRYQGLEGHGFVEVWLVKIRVEDRGSVREVIILVAFTPYFPLEKPSIYLGKKEPQGLPIIPHVDSSRLVCTFSNATQRWPQDWPARIVSTCISKARAIIEAGLNQERSAEFEREFLAYWEDSYGPKDSVKVNMLSTVDENDPEPELSLYHLNENYHDVFRYLLIGNDTFSNKVLSNMKEWGYVGADKQEILYLPDLRFENPPFAIRNAELRDRIQDLGENIFSDYTSFVHRNKSFPLIIFRREVSGRHLYFGLLHTQINSNIGGKRSIGSEASTSLFREHGNKFVSRISSESYSRSRLQSRTTGKKSTAESIKIGIAGLGSVGSFLCQQLLGLRPKELVLIDPDVLKVENLGRHFLGFNYLKRNKAEAFRKYVTSHSPFIDVQAEPGSIIDIVRTSPHILNNKNALIVAIGNDNLERWIADQVGTGLLTVPVIFVWVEPYLAGGHIIYLSPQEPGFYNDCYKDGIFKHSIIAPETYNDEESQLVLQEAGCQTQFTPYSGMDLTIFISAIHPILTDLLCNPPGCSRSFTWVGNIEMLPEKDIRISNWAAGKKRGDIICH